MNIRVGNKVNVSDWGEEYTSYDEWIRENAPNHYSKWLTRSDCYDENSIYRVVAVANHSDYHGSDTLCLIENENDIVLIGTNGVKCVGMEKYNRRCLFKSKAA